ncbi:MAG: alpha/beta hydrolase [Micavibrio sp.]|nr:alpha/beta hydrolase [Micavibrio sp.]|tara:strand:+ start:334 stop:1005 length:672 start_codon:yes stop_codon:yes gene_type:complete
MTFADQNSQKETVVLLHGILKSKTDMLKMKKALEKEGYDTLNIFYPSRSKSLTELASFINDKINQQPKPDKLHFVVHSMGGLVTRYYIDKYAPENIGNIVMLSTPNTGSEFADKLKAAPILSPLFKLIYGPAGQQLSTNYNHPIPKNTTIGIIAGTKSINPLSPFFLPRKHVGEHDGMVPVKRTHIDGETDHITPPVNHTTMMKNKDVINQTIHFLKYKKFDT